MLQLWELNTVSNVWHKRPVRIAIGQDIPESVQPKRRRRFFWLEVGTVPGRKKMEDLIPHEIHFERA
jgi:hypothetical protein